MEIFKYPIVITDHQQIMMPRGANLIHVGPDPSGQLCVWAKTDPKKEHKPVDIWVIGTGNQMPVDAALSAHLGSVNHDPFMWHIFWSSKR